eukprot:sb/3476867/
MEKTEISWLEAFYLVQCIDKLLQVERRITIGGSPSPILSSFQQYRIDTVDIIHFCKEDRIIVTPSGSRKILVPDWLITSHVTLITSSDWLFTCFPSGSYKETNRMVHCVTLSI